MCCARPTSPHLEAGTYSFERYHLDFAGAEMVVGLSLSLPARLLQTFRAQGNRLPWIGPGRGGGGGWAAVAARVSVSLQPHVWVQVSHAAPQPSLLPLFPCVPTACP